ncbi:hypothetical protein GQ55_1G086700 [Panicum hallii var. hallii]|uniref:Uncharacterized protein n=1 Tax=Panicum hallii var. hallii TaxID=1504633 RepID=A0A2T7F3N7_9POAL|nr:hypothetical protein GQ55_1G086700 [Panicum hallii var. hallii]
MRPRLRGYEEAGRAVNMCAASLLFASSGPTVARLPSVRCPPRARRVSHTLPPLAPFPSAGDSPVRTPTPPPRFPNQNPQCERRSVLDWG